MAVRKDGIQSSDKLMQVATEVFAEKGYHDTTIAEICKRADSNVASINYHFKSKDGLYAVVWKNAFEQSMKVYPLDGGLPDDAPDEKQLYALVHSLLHRVLDDGRLGCTGQILLREMAEPTDAIKQMIHDTVGPMREKTRQILQKLLGPDISDKQLIFCELSIVHQCIALGFAKSRNKLPPFLQNIHSDKKFIDDLADHITFFSLAGIRAVRERFEMKQNTSK